MSRIDTTFAALKAQGRKALIPFVTAGYPYADVTPELMHAMVAVGKLGDKASLAEYLQAREVPSPRKPLSELAAEGDFSL